MKRWNGQITKLSPILTNEVRRAFDPGMVGLDIGQGGYTETVGC